MKSAFDKKTLDLRLKVAIKIIMIYSNRILGKKYPESERNREVEEGIFGNQMII